jgi:hypothetical protein
LQADAGHGYSYLVRLKDAEMQRIATAIVDRLEKAAMMRSTTAKADLVKRIVGAFRANIRAEEEIEAEAEKFADAHKREMVGMDRHRVLQLVKERIAKERGFTL